jgi:hypothetical protein
MDALIAAAARALSAGDVLAALQRVALREDPPALALRGIAMAQLGEHARARELLRRAARGFGPQEARARARCQVAEAEVALALRDLGSAPQALAAAATTLARLGDATNAALARLIALRRLLLLGRLPEAAAALAALDSASQPPTCQAVAALAEAELALRSMRTRVAQQALARATEAAMAAGVPALQAEVAGLQAGLAHTAARRLQAGQEQALTLAQVEALLASGALVLDACRHGLRAGPTWLPLARRPVLFALAQALASAWPGDVAREALIEQVFRTRRPDETHRARLRVEIGRLRALAAPLASIEATPRGFRLMALEDRDVVLLLPAIAGEQAALQSLLADGAAWSTSALALALDSSQRTVQRALAELQAQDRVRAIGQGRTQRWLAAPLTGITTILLLPAALPLA